MTFCKRLFLITAAAGLALLFSSCRPLAAPHARRELQPPFRVVTTTGMVADLVAHVAAGHAAVVNIIGQGVDPHLYKPTRDDVEKLLNADIVFYSGLFLEGRLTETLHKLEAAGIPTFAVTDRIDQQRLLAWNVPANAAATASASHAWDPHVWNDPGLWLQCAPGVAEILGRLDPPRAQEYQQNAQAYVAELSQLDAYARQALGTIPEGRRVLVTAHDAFSYLGRAYGLEVLGVQGISTESEAGLQDIQRLVDAIVTRNVPAIFVEATVSPKNIQAVIEGAHARGHAVRIGASVFSDSMGTPGTYEGTYAGMIDHNVTAITLALGGQALARGWQGKLSGLGLPEEKPTPAAAPGPASTQ